METWQLASRFVLMSPSASLSRWEIPYWIPAHAFSLYDNTSFYIVCNCFHCRTNTFIPIKALWTRTPGLLDKVNFKHIMTKLVLKFNFHCMFVWHLISVQHIATGVYDHSSSNDTSTRIFLLYQKNSNCTRRVDKSTKTPIWSIA